MGEGRGSDCSLYAGSPHVRAGQSRGLEVIQGAGRQRAGLAAALSHARSVGWRERRPQMSKPAGGVSKAEWGGRVGLRPIHAWLYGSFGWTSTASKPASSSVSFMLRE